MKIVQFKSGEYGVRKNLFFFYLYADMVHQGYWWARDSRYFRDCKTKDLSKVEKFLKDFDESDVGTPINVRGSE